MSSTESRIAVVTGAAKRVGRAIALRLARDGWHLHLTWNRSEAAMKATADKCRQVGAASVVTHQIDLGELAAVSQWAAQLQTQIPSLHGLVHNASRYLPTSWGEVTPAEVEFHFRVNTAAPLLITQALDASLRGAGGSVVAFADIHVMGRPRKNFAAYSISKAGVVELVYTLARELAPEVRVNGIAPGVVAWPPDTDDAEIRAYEKRIPLGRPGTPEDAADVTHFLLSEASRYMSGEILRLDGGRWLR